MRNRWVAASLAVLMAMSTFSLSVCAEEAENPVPFEVEVFEDESVLAPESVFETVLQEPESVETELEESETLFEETEFIEETESIKETESKGETKNEKSAETEKETEIETAEETEEELEANYGNTAKGFVYRLYKLVLGREPDQKGLNEWTNYLTSGQKTGAEVADGFIYSKELTARKLSDSTYVEMLYKTFLNRSSDSSGKKYWVTRLQKGMSRAYVYRGFANSTEFRNICKQYGIQSGEVVLMAPKDQNEGVTMFVYRCYQKFLGRKPDDAGLNDWCNRLLTGKVNAKEAAYGFVMSKEFQNKNMSNTNYIKTIYLGLFDRTADSTGLLEWVEKLEAGNSRESVFYGFADSQEFRKLAEGFGLNSSWESTSITYKMSKTKFIQILLNNESVWKLDKYQMSAGSGIVIPGYSLMDLDLDGELEFIVHYEGGSMRNTPVDIYEVSESGLVKVCSGMSNWDAQICKLSLYQDRTTGKYVYIDTSFFHVSMAENYKYISEFYYSINGINRILKFYSGCYDANWSGNPTYVYKVNGQSVGEQQYNNAYNTYFGNLRDTNMKSGYILNKDWYTYSYSKKKQELSTLYDAFVYE